MNQREKLINNLLTENIYLNNEQEGELHKIHKRSKIEKFYIQVKETKKVYPDFNPEISLKDPAFIRLINIGVNVKNAYEVLNIDSILKRE